ncbi:DUF5951 family protein [Klebsiella michiganensis]
MESYLSGEKTFVKHLFAVRGSTGASTTNCRHYRQFIGKNALQD